MSVCSHSFFLSLHSVFHFTFTSTHFQSLLPLSFPFLFYFNLYPQGICLQLAALNTCRSQLLWLLCDKCKPIWSTSFTFLAHSPLLHPKFHRHNQRKNCMAKAYSQVLKWCFNYFYDTQAGCTTESTTFIWLLQKRSKKKYKSPQNTPIQKEHQLGKMEEGRAIYTCYS